MPVMAKSETGSRFTAQWVLSYKIDMTS